MLRQKRKEVEVFSLSFMDCICCGFGAVLLIFILTTGQKVDFSQQTLADLRDQVRRLEQLIIAEQMELQRLGRPSPATEADLAALLELNAAGEKKMTEQKEQLMLLLRQMGLLQKEVARLLEDSKALPREDEQPVPIPEIDRRQYLTGVKLEGSHVLFLVRVSGSMLGDSLDDAIVRLADPDFKKKESPKWQRVIKSVHWMIATLAPETQFQILLFNEETVPLLPSRGGGWIARSDKQGVQEALTRLYEVVPQGSANLERAFTTVRYMDQLPDAIVLLTDSLPTTSDTAPNPGDADDDARIRYFRYAQRQLPPRIPVSTILFPMTGDPGAAALYWELAGATRGALVSPAASWPDL